MAKTQPTGADAFPVTENAFYKAVETLAYQGIKAVQSSNPIANAFFEYPVDGNGMVIEEVIIEMAKAKAFVPTADGAQPDLSPLDPKLHVKYFNNFEPKTFKVSVRDDEIRKVLMKGESPETFASKIVDTLTQGYDFDELKTEAGMFNKTYFADFKTELGGAPLNMKGVLYAIREMASAVHATNAKGGVPCDMAVDLSDIRIAIPSDIKSVIDFAELANTFNMSVEEIKGYIVELPSRANVTWPDAGACVYVYDIHHLGKAPRKRNYAQEHFPTLEYSNYVLNTDTCYLVNGLAKGLFLDVSQAVTSAKNAMIGAK